MRSFQNEVFATEVSTFTVQYRKKKTGHENVGKKMSSFLVTSHKMNDLRIMEDQLDHQLHVAMKLM